MVLIKSAEQKHEKPVSMAAFENYIILTGLGFSFYTFNLVATKYFFSLIVFHCDVVFVEFAHFNFKQSRI